MIRFLTLTLTFLLVGPALAGDQPASDLAKKIAPLMEPQTFAVVHVQLDKLDHTALVKLATKIADLKPLEATMLELPLNIGLTTLKKNGAKEVFGVFSLEGFPFEPGFAAIPVADEATGKNIATALKNFLQLKSPQEAALVHDINGFVLIAGKNTVQRLTKLQPAAVSHLDKALAAFPKADARLAVVLPDALRKSLGELIPQFPAELGGSKTVPLLKGFQFFAAGVTITPNLSVEAVLKASDAKTAGSIRAVLLEGMNWFKNLVKKEALEPSLAVHVEKAVTLLTPKQDKDQLTWTLTEEEIVPIANQLVAKARKAASMAVDANNLKQIGLALHSYHDVHKHFPTNIYDKNGKALLSWRVQILPYVEEPLRYQKFKMDEPWDSAHNLPLSKKMPAVFRSPSSKAAADKTTYLGPFGKGLFLSGPTPIKFQDIKDGTSNTIVVLEVEDAAAVTWTKPDDLPIDPKQPLKGVGRNAEEMFQALFADGTVRAISTKIAPGDFYTFLTIAGGEPPPKLP